MGGLLDGMTALPVGRTRQAGGKQPYAATDRLLTGFGKAPLEVPFGQIPDDEIEQRPLRWASPVFQRDGP